MSRDTSAGATIFVLPYWNTSISGPCARPAAPCLCLSERGVTTGVVVVVWIGEPRPAVVYRARVRIAGRNTSVELFWCREMCLCCTTSPVARDRPPAGRQRIAGCQRRREAHCAGNTQEAVRCPSNLELEWHMTVRSVNLPTTSMARAHLEAALRRRLVELLDESFTKIDLRGALRAVRARSRRRTTLTVRGGARQRHGRRGCHSDR